MNVSQAKGCSKIQNWTDSSIFHTCPPQRLLTPYIQTYTCSVATMHSNTGNDTYKMKLLKITSHTATRRSESQCYFCETTKSFFLMQATQRIFNFIILLEHIFFYISILHFLNIIEYLTDLLHCH